MPDQIKGTERALPWRRLTAEGGAIVVSILLAFSIDAAWDSRQESVEEQGHLVALSLQFATDLEVIRTEVAEIEGAADATRALLDLDVQGAVATDADSLAQLFARIIRPGRANLPSGALDALMASGDLRLIQDRELASRLASWPSLVAEAYENAGWLVEARDRDLMPFLVDYVGGLWTAGRSGILEDYPPTRFPPKKAEMFSDPRLEGYLASRAVRLQLTLDRYGALARETDSIIALIQGQVGR
jgi:hypothetical protein